MLKCGFYESEITPPLGGHIPGYNRIRVADDVKTKLYVKSLALYCGDTQTVIIAIDGLKTTQHLCDGIYKRIQDAAGLSQEQILINATHSHTAGMYGASNEFAKQDVAYTDMLIKISADCGTLALKHMEEATVSYGCERVEGIAFIRNFKMKDGSIRTNPGALNPNIVEPVGEPDHDFPFLFFKNREGKLIGALSSFALHQDTVAGNAFCSDYSGVLSDELKKVYGTEFISVFLNGFCGNINHSNTEMAVDKRPKPMYVHIGKTLSRAILQGEGKTEALEVPFIGSSKKTLSVPKRKITPEKLQQAHELMKKTDFDFEKVNINDPESELFQRAKAGGIIEYAKTQDEPAHPVVQVLAIGECLVYAISGEHYVEFQHYIKEHSPSSKNLFSSNSNGGFAGYVPTKEMYEVPTLYEAQLPGACMVPGSGEKNAEELLKMAKEFFKK